MVVGAGAQLGEADLLGPRVAAGLLDREQSTRLLPLTLELLKQREIISESDSDNTLSRGDT